MSFHTAKQMHRRAAQYSEAVKITFLARFQVYARAYSDRSKV